MDKIKSLKVKQADGTLGPAIALGADAANVDMADGSSVESSIVSLKNNTVFRFKNSGYSYTQGFIFTNQDIIDFVNFCKANPEGRDFSAEDASSQAPYLTLAAGVNLQTAMTTGCFLHIRYINNTSTPNTLHVTYSGSFGMMTETVESYDRIYYAECVAMFSIESALADPSGYMSIISESSPGVVSFFHEWEQAAKKSDVYTKTEVNDLIGNLSSLDLQIVTTLPTSNISTSTIYLIAREDGETNNYYEEYIYISNKWEMIGTTNATIDTSTFDEVYVGSSIPTSESVEVWVNPNDGVTDYGVDAYTKSEVDAKITTLTTTVNNKANKGEFLADYGITNAYTKTEVDNLINEVENLIDSAIATSITNALEASY